MPRHYSVPVLLPQWTLEVLLSTRANRQGVDRQYLWNGSTDLHSHDCRDPRRQFVCCWLTEKNYTHGKTGGLSQSGVMQGKPGIAHMACAAADGALQQEKPIAAYVCSQRYIALHLKSDKFLCQVTLIFDLLIPK